jgi:hypothetical protein
MIGGGALGQPAATAVRHVAAQNGVWSLGNFGGVPPKSAMMYYPSGGPETDGPPQSAQTPQDASILPNKIEEGDYRHIFNSCTVGMVRHMAASIVVVCVCVEKVFLVHTVLIALYVSFLYISRRLPLWVVLLLIATNCSVNLPTTRSKKCAQ